jgi:hypothetical protein
MPDSGGQHWGGQKQPIPNHRRFAGIEPGDGESSRSSLEQKKRSSDRPILVDAATKSRLFRSLDAKAET